MTPEPMLLRASWSGVSYCPRRVSPLSGSRGSVVRPPDAHVDVQGLQHLPALVIGQVREICRHSGTPVSQIDELLGLSQRLLRTRLQYVPLLGKAPFLLS